MTGTMARLLAALTAVAILQTSSAPTALAQPATPLRVASERTVSGVPFPESVGYDAQGKVLYVSQFVSELKPAEKDGKGRISKVSLTGEILEAQFLPAAGDVLNKPKGIWIQGDRLWVTDIDVVWVFDLETRKGRKAALPDAKFANDPTVMGNALYVSDNRSDALYRVEPADFLEATSEPKVTRVFSGKSVNPNGLYPGRDGSLLMVGFLPGQPRGIYALSPGGEVTPISKALGELDGLYQADDGTLLVTDWKSGSLLRWSPSGDVQTLASGFKGPADFAVAPESGGGLLVVVPDLVKSELRLIHLARERPASSATRARA